MTKKPGLLDGVDVLLPLRVHQARRQLMHRMTADMAAVIQALPTAGSALVADPPDDAGPDRLKAWARSVIDSLPTRTEGEPDHGTR